LAGNFLILGSFQSSGIVQGTVLTLSVPQLNPLAASRFARAVRARPAPPPAVPFGPLVVEGDADLAGTLVLQFASGVAPSLGDAFELIDVAGSVSGGFENVVVRGLTTGAESFAQDLAGGKLTLTSLGDLEALPAVSLKAKPLVKEKKAKKGLKVAFKRAGDASQPLLVRYEVRGTARNGLDYEHLPGAIEIPARKKSAKLVIRPFRDGVPEGFETIELEVVPGDGYAPGRLPRATIELESET
jgi:hypothetical protein